MKCIRLILISICAVNLYAETYSVKGKFIDTLTGKGINQVNVLLLNLKDSSKIVEKTNITGNFQFHLNKKGHFQVVASHISFRKFEKEFDVVNTENNLGTICLIPDYIETNDIVVTGKVIAVVRKKDTTEYNAAAFKVNKDAEAGDLVSKMPGMVVQNGTVKSNGEEIKKVVVDGKDYFGSDPQAALRNIPADVIDKIQIFDKKSDQAEFTGFDDGNSTKTLNIMTKNRAEAKTFGKFTAAAGSDKTYQFNGNYTVFNGDTRLAVVAQLNNINVQNFTPEMGGSFPQGFGGMSGTNGITTTKALGVQFSDNYWGKLDVNGSYFFNQIKRDAEQTTLRNYFSNALLNQIYNQEASSTEKITSHNFNMRMDYKVDDNNIFTLDPRIKILMRESNSSKYGNNVQNSLSLSSFSDWSTSDITTIDASVGLFFRHKFETKGRTVSVRFNTSANSSDGDSYQSTLKTTSINDTTENYTNINNKGKGFGASLVYTEPIASKNLLSFSYRYSYNDDKNDQKKYNTLTFYDVFEPTLSNVYKKESGVNSFGLGYMYKTEKINLMSKLDYNITNLSGKQEYPSNYNTNRTFYSILPSTMFWYIISKYENMHFDFRFSNNIPTISQLQNVLNTSDPTRLSIGNPNLKQDNTIMAIMHYSKTFRRSESTLMLMAGITKTDNYIGNNIFTASNDTTYNGIKLGKGVQLSIPKNIDGYFNLRSFCAYNLPVTVISSNLNFSVNYDYTKTPSILDDNLNYAKTSMYGFSTMLSSGITENIDFTLSSNSSYTKTINTYSNAKNSDYLTETGQFKIYWLAFWNLVLQSDVSYTYNSGNTDLNKNTWMLNYSFGKKFLDNKLDLRISVNNALNEYKNYQHNTTDSYVEDVRSNSLGRYYMFNISYKL